MNPVAMTMANYQRKLAKPGTMVYGTNESHFAPSFGQNGLGSWNHLCTIQTLTPKVNTSETLFFPFPTKFSTFKKTEIIKMATFNYASTSIDWGGGGLHSFCPMCLCDCFSVKKPSILAVTVEW